MISDQTATIAEIILSAILACIYIVGGYSLTKCFKNSRLKIKSDIKISIILYIISYIIFEIAGIIRAIYRPTLNSDALKYHIDHQVYYISYLVFFLSDILWVVSFNYFLVARLHSCFHTTFLEIRRRYIMILFGIYFISVFLYFGSQIWSDVLPFWFQSILIPSENTLNALRILYSAVVVSYQFTIMVLFNVKLFKLMQSCKNSSYNSAATRNQQLVLSVITKQTNLMTLIISVGLFLYIIQYTYYGTILQNNNNIFLIYIIAWSIKQIIIFFGVVFGFEFNHNYYLNICKYSHLACVKVCLYTTSIKQKKSAPVFKYHRMSELCEQPIPNKESYVQPLSECKHTLQNVLQCPHVSTICNVLLNEDVEESTILNMELLNAFHHTLECHDDTNSFHLINQYLLDHTNNNCDIKRCPYLQKRNQTNINWHKTISSELHGYYFHSYDVRTVHIREKSDLITTYGSIGNTEEATVKSKFMSDIKELEDMNNNIYSFGKRFQYLELKSDDNAKQLHVTAKYNTIKQEVLHNQIFVIDLQEWDRVFEQSMYYLDTNYIKVLQNKSNIVISNTFVTSILLYCNFDTFQRKWSETFRKIPYNETDKSLIDRHSNFYHCSKALREFVETFGTCLTQNEDKKFYHGINKELLFYCTIAQFNAPLSTSTKCVVAMNFTAQAGIILELSYCGSPFPMSARYLDCSYFSRFVEEKECLFVGGIPLLQIMNIINVAQNNRSYRKYLNALNLITSVMNGAQNNYNKITYDQPSENLCCSLLKNQIKNSDCSEFDQYIVNLVKNYCEITDKIVLFWHNNFGSRMFRQIKHLLCDRFEGDDVDFFNMNVLLSIYPNLTKIEYSNKKINESGIFKILQYIISECLDLKILGSLQLIIFHHQISSGVLTSMEKELDDNESWNIFQKQKIIVLHRQNDVVPFDISCVKLHSDEINQSRTTQILLESGLFSHT